MRAAALTAVPPPSVALAPPPAPPAAAPPPAPAPLFALGAGAAALLLLMAAAVGCVLLFAGKRSPQLAHAPLPPVLDPSPPVQAEAPTPTPQTSPEPQDDASAVPPKPPTAVAPPAAPAPTAAPLDAAEPNRPAEPAPTLPPPPAVTPAPAPPPAAFKRRDQLAEEDLRKQLLQVPELALDAPGDVRTATQLFTVAVLDRARNQAYPGPIPIVRTRPELDGIPLATGLDSQLGKEPAENLQALSRQMRETVAACLPAGGLDPRPDADVLRQRLLADGAKQWLTPESVPCLLQMLQPENKPVRLVLVEALGRIPGKRATAALAMRSIMDLSPEVREAAVHELRNRPLDDSRDVLLHGLRYLWAPVIDHAAEALAALGDKEAAPALVPLLDLPDPTLPTLVKKDKAEVNAVPELVRVNHLRNCVLCHAPSLDRQDLVRGAVPSPGKALPAPASTPQYYETGERFVRADITYLRQDFSVMQPVAQPGVWPDYQRFDYMVRLRRPKGSEYETASLKKRPLGDEPREAVLFALRELTGRDAGVTAASWRTALGKAAAPASPAEAAGDDWRQFRGTLQSLTASTQSDAAERLKDDLLASEDRPRADLIRRLAEGDDPADVPALARAVPFLKGPAQSQARDALADRLGRLPESELRDRLAEDDPEVRRAAARACAHREDKGKALAADLIPLLTDADTDVAQAAHAVLAAATGRDFGPAAIGATSADREKARAAWEAWWVKQDDTGR